MTSTKSIRANASSRETDDNASTIQDTYRGPRHQGEYDRLTAQHDMFKVIMNGKLVLAPVDLSSPSLHVLDSATADGYWLQDLASSLSPSAVLRGADIAPQHFLKQPELRDNIKLFAHNMFDNWPDNFQNSFDLVHQRFVLPVCSDATSESVIRKLIACVKPGGWIQLHDSDFETIDEGTGHEAMERFRNVMQRSWKMLGYTLSPGPKLAGWLRQAGLANVEQQVLRVDIGASAEDSDMGNRPINVILAALEGIEVNLGGMPGYFFSASDFAQLKRDLKEEFEVTGNHYQTYVAWGQKQS